jgi:hypothetical protein
VPVAVAAVPVADAGYSGEGDGRERKAGSRSPWLRRLAVLGVPCLLLCCLLGGLLVYFVGSSGGKRDGPTTSERLKVTDKQVQYPRGREGDQHFARYCVTVEDEQGGKRTLYVNDSFLAARFQPEDLYENIELFKTYQVIFKGGKHHFAGLTPKCRSHDPKEMTELIQQSMEAEMQVFDVLWEGNPRERDEARNRILNRDKAGP